ncbi:transglutaminase domain-containing protein [Pedobacter chinensis]|uniref:Transglutaminase domain-containing protein n=1 Tax=Pedobacter chinensis TaxID=2282421 RepID=A0A369Q7B7_9SPHI|nr:transglutaminase domain-containing protein [Pedobacter chinensis]RDC58178.1 transglutaminase domain-containing protein [Pedobacter chinensis]
MKKLNITIFFILGMIISEGVSAQSVTPEVKELQAGKEYNKAQVQTFPDFGYQDANSPELKKIREKYNLDAVAGAGTDVERAKHLLKWFHNEVPHNDDLNIDPLNAISIIDSYREKKQNHGCYPLSIAMNEIFLAMGYKSRSVICFSGHYPDSDGGHVINSVFIPSLKKWIYMDPQDNAYVSDENNNLLSIAEVRERLISGLPLKLNEDANYHHVPTNIKDYLYTFMAKNLYRLICPLQSEFNSQTITSGKTMLYVELLPVGSKDPVIDKFETRVDEKKNVKIINYHTNNSELFWKIPG